MIDCTPMLFTKEIKKEQWIIGEDEVQKKIQEINKEERDRKKTMSKIYNSIRFFVKLTHKF